MVSRRSQSLKSPPVENWSARYGDRHRLERITEFPAGIAPPHKVRLYRRQLHFVLQWWDPAQKRTLTDRVEGDLLAALMRAREIDERIRAFRSAGTGNNRLRHVDLVQRFLEDLERRANAREISPKTVSRYRSALSHYLRYVGQPAVSRQYPWVHQVNRTFALELASWLRNTQVSPNGHPHTAKRRMVSCEYVLDVIRSQFRWGMAPTGGNLLPAGFINPFAERGGSSQEAPPDLFGDPDISTEMASEFLLACDSFQLRLFAPLILFGLRAGEPAGIFEEDLEPGWLHVRCRPELDLLTKGRRHKRLPLSPSLFGLLRRPNEAGKRGLLFSRRGALQGRSASSWSTATPDELSEEYRRRCEQRSRVTAAQRLKIRDRLLRETGGLRYDDIEYEFRGLARQLTWPDGATLKDFRHLFSTLLENAGVPLFYRRYLMGQSPGRSAIVAYTHLNELQAQYQRALDTSLQPLLNAVLKRQQELSSAFGDSESRGNTARIA